MAAAGASEGIEIFFRDTTHTLPTISIKFDAIKKIDRMKVSELLELIVTQINKKVLPGMSVNADRIAFIVFGKSIGCAYHNETCADVGITAKLLSESTTNFFKLMR